MTAPRLLCIGTHHKCGTVWMRRVWHAVARAQGLPLIQVNRAKRLADVPESGPAIVVNWSSTFPADLFDDPQARFLHLIRDPRDVLVSAMRYHLAGPAGRERFLHRPRPAWGGRSYRDRLRALPDDGARHIFEMEHKHLETLTEMAGWPWGLATAVDLRYEDLVADPEGERFRAALARVAPPGLDVAQAVASYRQEHIDGGLSRPDSRSPRQARHIVSGRPGQWRHHLSREVAALYAARHGPLLARLGYVADDSWVAECRPAREMARAA
jgi:hypothetical protein